MPSTFTPVTHSTPHPHRHLLIVLAVVVLALLSAGCVRTYPTAAGSQARADLGAPARGARPVSVVFQIPLDRPDQKRPAYNQVAHQPATVIAMNGGFVAVTKLPPNACRTERGLPAHVLVLVQWSNGKYEANTASITAGMPCSRGHWYDG